MFEEERALMQAMVNMHEAVKNDLARHAEILTQVHKVLELMDESLNNLNTRIMRLEVKP